MDSLHVRVHDLRYPVDENVIRSVFSPIANPRSVHMVPNPPHGEAIAVVRFDDHNAASACRQQRDGRCIYSECNRMEIAFTKYESFVPPRDNAADAPTVLGPYAAANGRGGRGAARGRGRGGDVTPMQQPQQPFGMQPQQQQQAPWGQQQAPQQQQPPQMSMFGQQSPGPQQQQPQSQQPQMMPVQLQPGQPPVMMMMMPGQMAAYGAQPQQGGGFMMPQYTMQQMQQLQQMQMQQMAAMQAGGRGGRGGAGASIHVPMTMAQYGPGGASLVMGGGGRGGRGGGAVGRGGGAGAAATPKPQSFVNLQGVAEDIPLALLFEFLEVYGKVLMIRRNRKNVQLVTVKFETHASAHTAGLVTKKVSFYGSNITARTFESAAETVTEPPCEGDPSDPSVHSFNFALVDNHREHFQRGKFGTSEIVRVVGMPEDATAEAIHNYFANEVGLPPVSVSANEDRSFTVVFESIDAGVRAVCSTRGKICGVEKSAALFERSEMKQRMRDERAAEKAAQERAAAEGGDATATAGAEVAGDASAAAEQPAAQTVAAQED